MLMDNDKISTRQAIVFLISIAIGAGILSLPRQVDEMAGQDGWISIILGGIITLIGGLIVAALVARQKEDAVKISEKLAGRFITWVIGVFYIIYFLMISAVVNQTSAEVINQFLLEHTPKGFTIFSILLLGFYAVRVGIEPAVRTVMVLFPSAMFVFALIIFTCLSKAKIDEILPVMTTPFKNIFFASQQTLFALEGFEVLLFLAPYLRKPEKAKIIVTLYTAVTTLFYLFITVVTFMVLGKNETKFFVWPVFMMIRGITAPGEVFERLDAFAITIWVVQIFTTLVGYYFSTAIIVKSLFNLKEESYLSAVFLPLFYFAANLPNNFAENKDLAGYVNYLIYPAAFFIPAFLLLLSFLKKAGGKS